DRLEAGRAGELIEQVQTIAGVPCLIARLDDLDGKQLREQCDKLRDRLPSGVIVLAGACGDKAALLVAVSKDLTNRLQAGKLIAPLAERVGGKGGGRPDLAQAGGSRPEGLTELLQQAPALLAEALQS
ncbi:MAG: DHHA1 domain-containing protein, partial [Desulfuromonas sp.]